jgi:hypothetical protein
MIRLKAGGVISRNREIFILGNIPEFGWKHLEQSESIFWGHAMLNKRSSWPTIIANHERCERKRFRPTSNYFPG